MNRTEYVSHVFEWTPAGCKAIIAEYDRLTALNKQLVEACRHYLINPQSPMVHDEIEAAIRAAEEGQR